MLAVHMAYVQCRLQKCFINPPNIYANLNWPVYYVAIVQAVHVWVTSSGLHPTTPNCSLLRWLVYVHDYVEVMNTSPFDSTACSLAPVDQAPLFDTSFLA